MASQGFPLSLSGVLRTAVAMVDAAGRRVSTAASVNRMSMERLIA